MYENANETGEMRRPNLRERKLSQGF